MGITFPLAENFLKNKKQLLTVVCSVTQRTEQGKLPLWCLKKPDKSMTRSSALDLSLRVGISLYSPVHFLQEVRKKVTKKEEQNCGKSSLGNNLTYKARKVMMV